MMAVNTQSVLMQIQPTIIRFAKMLASVLQLEIEIVDINLVRVAGTGPYAKSLGRKLNANSRLLKHVIESKKEKVVTQSGVDPICEGCTDKQNCREKAFLGTPVMFQNSCVGVISLVALNCEQQERIKDNLREFSDYVQHISNIVISKLLEDQSGESNASGILLSLIDNMDQGVLIFDKNNQLKFANPVALKILKSNHEQLLGKTISARALTFQNSFTSGNMQYIISLDNRSEIIIGQLLTVQENQIFLMAFHQSHTVINTDSSNEVPQIEHLIGECQPMQALKRLIGRIAPGPSSVMITGESGTGKEVVAWAIHKLSNRNDKPFIAINCAAIPEQLLESELFGYVKGAFTGASTNGKQGLIQAADQGTLFLDEIGDMPLVIQAKLLRAIEAREVQPIGSSRPIPVDIRIISATNQNLEKYVSEGKFREDLYYRLNVIPVILPPLRDRKEDLSLLIHYFLNLHTKRIGLVYPGIAADVMALLAAYQWPGNLRELSNMMEYLVNVVPSGEVITTSLLPPNIVNQRHIVVDFSRARTEQPQEISELPEHGAHALEEMEKQLIAEALVRHGNKKLAADELGIGIATLYRKIKKYGTDDKPLS
ncbi:sigma-54-dependent transcriptional regulator [Buttiauxella ferragutiae ATCC 51602]|uniref:Sigma-54-dependent transcriptional regulator n=1 Tax=Buttiauxella ferragutiae ATCC 51602 TaxID=1354252 RepID=A0ABX2W484_9ENTR|nr:sigma 54-interacting transcriptional regulator [Buttiauxella ferragutiae]OAT25267.1 sigma-54-dependent transcriptional regulator [Buttiauxella ferragutiae ATCC 51602]